MSYLRAKGLFKSWPCFGVNFVLYLNEHVNLTFRF